MLIKIVHSVGIFLGNFCFYFLPIRRKIVLDNLARAYDSQKTAQDVQKLAQKNYEHYGKMFCEIIFLRSKKQLKHYTQIQHQEVMDEALYKGKGILLLGAHLGNWEVMVRSFFLLQKTVHVVARRIKTPWLNACIEKLRTQSGLEFIPAQHSYHAILSLLKQNKIVGLVLDQHKNAQNRALYVEFFNRPAATSTGIASLALASGAAVIPTYQYRNSTGGFTLVLEPPLELKRTRNLEEDIFYNTQLFTHALEVIIRRYPEQWFWAHQRWKGTVPPYQTIKPIFKIVGEEKMDLTGIEPATSSMPLKRSPK